MRRMFWGILLLLAAFTALGPREAPAGEPTGGGKGGTYFYVKGVPYGRWDDHIARYQFNADGSMSLLDWVPVGDNSTWPDWPGQSLAYAPASANSPSILITGGFSGITTFRVALDGALTQVTGSPFQGNQAMTEITGVATVRRQGVQYVYGAETKQNRIRGFQVQSDGSLVELPSSPFPTAPAPFALATGETYLFATGQVLQQTATLNSYRVNLDGSLTQPDGSPYPVWSTAVTHAATEPMGARFTYIGCRWRPQIYAFNRLGAGPRLTPVPFPGYSTGSFVPNRGILQGFGDLVFALSDARSAPLQALRRDLNGKLTPLSALPTTAHWQVTHGALHPGEAFVLLIDRNGIAASVAVDRTTGAMTLAKDTWLAVDYVTGVLFVQP